MTIKRTNTAATGGGGGGGVPDDGSVTDAKVAADAAIAQSKVADLVADLAGRTALTVDGEFAATYDLDTTPPTAADVGAYTQAEVDALIAAATAESEPFSGTSMWDIGNIESLNRNPGFADKTLISGTLWLQQFYAPRTSNPIVNLGYSTRATAPSGVTLARMALFTIATNGNITKVAQTATFTPSGTFTDQVNALSTTGGFPSSYTLNRGAFYGVGLLLVATTPGNTFGFDIPGAGNNPQIVRRVASQTDIAGSYTNAQLSAHYEGIYLFGRHATG